jgi:hypothetical protein
MSLQQSQLQVGKQGPSCKEKKERKEKKQETSSNWGCVSKLSSFRKQPMSGQVFAKNLFEGQVVVVTGGGTGIGNFTRPTASSLRKKT